MGMAKLLFSSPREYEIGLLKNMLEGRGIVCALRNANLMGTAGGGLPAGSVWAELWVARDADWEKAEAILTEWRKPKVHDQPDWTCSKCGEKVEGQFDVCWKCGETRPD